MAPGFVVVTGETGAGKSIIIGALQLLLGERADFETTAGRECRRPPSRRVRARLDSPLETMSQPE
jgi:energy-coupling factor transporter ATP-binding protein EcfA2